MSEIRTAFVVAMDRNRVIGRAGGLPWRIPADLKFFKAVTMGKPVVMGRRTWQSIGRALPGRANIVVSRDPGFRAEGAVVAPSLDAALDRARAIARADGVEEVMVIGGAEIYALSLPRADRLYVTEVQADVEGDTWFPDFDRAAWREVSREDHAPEDATPGYSFIVLERMAGAESA